MDNIQTGQRTFYIALSATDNSSQFQNVYDIPFRDTSGNIIRCNYVKVVCTTSGLGGNGSFVFEPSGVSRVGSNNITSIPYSFTVPASGILGAGSVYGGGCFGIAEWHGSNGEVANGIRLRHQTGFTQHITFGITYGNLFPYNQLRGLQPSGSYDRGV